MKATPDQNALMGIALKIGAVVLFVGMASLIKASGQVPAGQIVFYRSFFALFPIIVVLGWRGELRDCVYTRRPMGHVSRSLLGVVSMGLGFYALTRLPLPEATALNYAQPLMVVILSALFFGERVRFHRWSAVLAGLLGVAIISWPKLTLFGSGHAMSSDEFAGVLAALSGACISGLVTIILRNLVATERTSTIVVWLSVTCSLAALLTLPFGWADLSATQMALLVGGGILGGIAQLLMTESYRYAAPSTVAPFDYISVLLAIVVGYFAFGDVPTIHVLVGGTIVIVAGVFIIWRERRLGIERAKVNQNPG
ncbi:MAG: DMT family transporter [Rhizobiaceae bacterium]